MPSKDIHLEPFDKGTIAKLEMFEAYAQEWIPTVVLHGFPEIHIFDFFSGPGYDAEKIAGSSIRVLEKIDSFLGQIFQKKTKITLHFNEYDSKKYQLLQKNCEDFLEEHPKFKHFAQINYYNQDAGELFFELLPAMDKYPSLVFLDQNGIKFISKEYITALEKLNTLDFLYYVSSSYFKRLGLTDEFKRVLDFDPEELEKTSQKLMHRAVLGKIESRLPKSTDLKLFPYSIKKGPNIYGIIFGAKHFRAVDKFLRIAWSTNQINGEANFDIDDDQKKGQLDMFDGQKMTKIESFQHELEEKLLNGELKSNKDVLLFTFERGHIPKHTQPVFKKLKTRIQYEGIAPKVNYDNVFKKKVIVEYSIKE
ncbi:MAG: three-Cys-motif partner protein TcmP [Cryomorphaceae bacterium]|nr:MAG: three-Cys-motif partner protein TcmP [Cryomorphaceae bacterium]